MKSYAARETGPRLASLRRRIIAAGIAIILVVVAGALAGYLMLESSRDTVADHLRERNVLLQHTQSIRGALVKARTSLDLFLLEPADTAHREGMNQAIAEAARYTNRLASGNGADRHGVAVLVPELREALADFRADTDELIAVRLDPRRQYPAMAVGLDVMQPSRNRLHSAFTVIFNELHKDPAAFEDPKVQELWAEARLYWMQALSNFRLYLANRVGSFDETALPFQEDSIDTLYFSLEGVFAELDALKAEGALGFQAGSALDEAREAARRWHEGFKETQRIHHSADWRSDARIMRERVAPAIGRIDRQLSAIEGRLNEAVSTDIATITQAAQRQTVVIWITALLGIGLVLSILAATNRLVFRPLGQVTRAMKAESMNREGQALPMANTEELADLVEAFNEMQLEVRTRQDELAFRTLYDELTGLPNRTLLLERLQHDIQRAKRDGGQVSLLMIDLDRFKEVNESLGHQIGDCLLMEVGSRFAHCLNETDTLARLGGDEFGVLVSGAGPTAAVRVGESLLAALEQPVVLGETQLLAAASIGIAVYPDHGEDAQQLLQHADVAMYVAKRRQCRYAIYDQKEDESSVARLEMIRNLRETLESGSLQLAFQPLLRLKSGEVTGVEALLRYRMPEHGAVSPEVVVDLAEQTGLIDALTEQVLDKALAQVRYWERAGYRLDVAVNLSMQSLNGQGFGDKLDELLDRYHLSGDRLTLEVTESAMMANPRQAVETLNRLVERGVQIVVDDFGTGFSSLSRLKELPVHGLKIDKAFVMSFEDSASDRAIVNATVRMAQGLGLEVVAEGVETPATLEALKKMECNCAQGFYIARPMPPDRVLDWLGARRTG